MMRNECKNQIISFRAGVVNYERTILNPDYSLPRDTQAKLIPIQQSQLNQTYGKLEKYTSQLTKAEKAYATAFLNGERHEVLKAIALVTRDLDYIVGKLDSMSDEEFNNLFSNINVKNFSVGKSYDIENVKTRLGVLEFLTVLFFSICFTLIFAIIKIQGFWFNWPALIQYFGFFFGIALLVIYIILPVIEISKKVGLGVKDIFFEFIVEFKKKSKLRKFITCFSVLAGIYLIYQIAEKILNLLK